VRKPRVFTSIGGGIHYGAVAMIRGDSPVPETMRYDLASKRLVVTSGKSVFRSDPIDPATFKALYRYAQSEQNLAVSIGWAGSTDYERRGQPVLLDPPFIDTRVGQDLILADQIPWEFDKPLPNGAVVPFREQFAAAEQAREQQRNAARDHVARAISRSLIGVKPLGEGTEADVLAAGGTDLISAVAILIYKNDTKSEVMSELAEVIDDSDARAAAKDLVDAAFISRFKSSSLTRLARRAANYGWVPSIALRLAWAEQRSLGTELSGLHKFALDIVDNLPNTTLAVLHDDSASFWLSENRLTLNGRMKYMYLTQYMAADWKGVRASKPEDPDQEVQHLEAHEGVVNGRYDGIVRAYPPLQRVTEYARMISFLRWVRDHRSEVLTDFTSLASVAASDPRRTPTIDAIREAAAP
jgi:hypothetical protein